MPRLPKKVRELLTKSRDSAILAVDIYNKPSTKFRSYGFIVMMNIAWTSLFLAIFERDGIKYHYKKPNSNRYYYVDGEKKAWDISKCVKEYFKEQNPPSRENLKFFVGLRNQIEHKFLPALDLEICGECQALLLNYEKLITQEFGQGFSLNESLAIPLQLVSINPNWRNQVLKEIQSREYLTIKEYVDTFRNSLDDVVWDNPEYSFKVFLIPKIGNRKSSSDLAIEFVPYDQSKPEEMKEYKRITAIIKEKQVPVVNPGKLKPGEVAERIKKTLNIPKFDASFKHAQCWKYYGIRPEHGSENPEKTDTRYCHYDAAHNDYVYTEEWVKFLISELSDAQKRREILGTES